MEKTSGEKLREEGCFFLFWLKIHVKKNPIPFFLCRVFFSLFFSSPPPEAGVVRIRKVKKTEMFFRCCFFFSSPECVLKNPQKPRVCFPAPAFVCRCFFFFSTADMEVESQTVQRHISVVEGKSVFPQSVSLKGCFTFKPFFWANFYNIHSGSGCFQIQWLLCFSLQVNCLENVIHLKWHVVRKNKKKKKEKKSGGHQIRLGRLWQSQTLTFVFQQQTSMETK